MKRLLLILILTFSFQSLSKADDIRDFQIEDMSIGDSALDYFSKKDIKKNSRFYRVKTFTLVVNDDYPSKTYDAIDFHFKTGDEKYIFQNIDGVLFFDNEIENCIKKMDSIAKDIEKNLDYIKKFPREKFIHGGDKTKKSLFYQAKFDLEDGYVTLICYDYSSEYGGRDNLSVSIDTPELNEFLLGDIY